MDTARIWISPWHLFYKRMKEVLLGEKLFRKLQKALIVHAEKSSGSIEDCKHETSSKFFQEMEEGVPIAKA